MISVLKNWNEIGEATKALRKRRLPHHGLAEKDWDLIQIVRLMAGVAESAPIVDLGCGGLYTLKLLEAMGFRQLSGIDFKVDLITRPLQLKRLVSKGRLPFKVHQGDILKTPFPDETFEVAISLSTIEHNVNLDNFFAEASRILKPGGRLFLSTDYWPDGVEQSPDLFGLPWHIFNKNEAEKIPIIAMKYGLQLIDQDSTLTDAEDRTVVWQGCEYTFLSMAFSKVAPTV